MIDWGSLEKKKPAPEPELLPADGPETIFPGVSCRLMIRGCADAEKRDADLTRRIYRLAHLLLRAEGEGISSAPQDGYRQLLTGRAEDAPVYVRGADSRSVVTTLGRALISAGSDTLKDAQALGVRVLLEW